LIRLFRRLKFRITGYDGEDDSKIQVLHLRDKKTK